MIACFTSSLSGTRDIKFYCFSKLQTLRNLGFRGKDDQQTERDIRVTFYVLIKGFGGHF